jgi:protein-tyrosine phosphatase
MGTSTRVLFICYGNICRSPTAEAVLRHLAANEAPHLDIVIDSAGTADYHIDSPPDRRTIEAARRRGIDMTSLRARQLQALDAERFDYLLVMDQANLSDAREMLPESHRERVRLFMEYASQSEAREVPDPYYGDAVGFELVLDFCEDAARGLLADIQRRRSKLL